MKQNTILAVIVIGVLVAIFAGFIQLPNLQTGTTTGATVGTTTTTTTATATGLPSCILGTAPVIQFSAFDSINTATARTDLNVNVYRNSSKAQTLNLGSDTTADVSVNEKVKAYVTGLSNNTTYFGRPLDELTVPCADNTPVNLTVDLVGTASFTINNSNTAQTNAEGTDEAVGSGGTSYVKITIRENTADAYLNSQYAPADKPLLVVYDYNSSVWQSITPAGIDYIAGSVPNGHTTLADINGTASSAYLLTGIPYLKDFENKVLETRFTAVSGVNPGTNDSIGVRLYMSQYMQHPTTGVWDWYFRNPDTGAVIIAVSDARIFVS